MADGRTIVFLHGAGGPIDPLRWLDPLNHRLTSLGFSRLDPSVDKILAPAYLNSLMRSSSADEPIYTWRKADRPAEKLEYAERAEVLARFVRRFEEHSVGPDLSWVPDFVATEGAFADWARNYLAPVRHYQHDQRRRWAAQRAVIRQLPARGDIVLVAHSLGSVVARDILPKLPNGLTVGLLVTIGSPLALKNLGKEQPDDFPFDRVGAWLNLYDPRDVVTVGRGIAARHTAAIDIPVCTDWAHDAVGYLSTKAVAATLGVHMFGDPEAGRTPNENREIRPRIHQAWNSLLLSGAYATQLSAACSGNDWRLKRRLDTARRVVAERSVENANATRRNLREEGAAVGGTPVELGRCPSVDEILHHAASLVRDVWSDRELVSLAVALAMSPPVPPFDLEVDEGRRHRALINTLNRIRRRGGNLSDDDFARAVRRGVEAGENALKDSGFPWGTVLFGAGLIALAATGVGLAVAAPAGLAGAAAITATLAAFGPGGMVGGIVTIAALTGVGAAATGIGVGASAAEQQSADEMVRQIAIEELAGMSPAALRNAVAALLAVVETQRNLEFESSATLVAEALQAALDLLLEERRLHREIAPDRPGTKEISKRVDILEKALGWMQERYAIEHATFGARAAFREATRSSSAPSREDLTLRYKSITQARTTKAIEPGEAL